MTRPAWWPRSWPWPASPEEGGDEPGPGLPPAASRDGTGDPAATFLRTLAVAFGAERATLYRLNRGREAWELEDSADGGNGDREPPRPLPARGHPLSWCLREELVAQLPRGELAGDRRAGGWSLAGPVPGSDRVLVMVFGGSPPAGARRALDSARKHVAALEVAGVLDREPDGTGA